MRVLFATDGAAPSERAGAMLARLADRAGTHVVVMSVNDFDVAMREAQLSGHFSTEEGHAAARLAADGATEALRAAGFEHVEARVEDGDEASEIVHAASTEDLDLVVVGSGKESWLDSVVLGSVSSSVLHGSPCPVLVVHRAPESDGPVRVVIGADGSEGASHSIAAFAAFADPARCAVTVITAAAPLALPPGVRQASPSSAARSPTTRWCSPAATRRRPPTRSERRGSTSRPKSWSAAQPGCCSRGRNAERPTSSSWAPAGWGGSGPRCWAR